MTEALDYPFTVRPLAREYGGGYLCEVPDLPSVMGDGATVEDAMGDGRKALKAALATLRGLGHRD